MFRKAFSDSITVEFTSASPESVLEGMIGQKIPVSRVEQISELTYRMVIRRKDYGPLRRILHRRGASFRVLEKNGIYWSAKQFLQRPVLVATGLLLVILTAWLPSRVLFVSVEGNTSIPDQLILSAAEQCGIYFGASRKQVRSERVKNELLSAVSQLQWAGINTSGCTASISVRERTEESGTGDIGIVSSIIAQRDGYVLSATASSGTLAVQPGESVTKGQLLISGFTDCGFCIRASRAEGEILAQTNRNLQAVTSRFYAVPVENGETKCKISLLLGKKRINLWKDSRISDTSCGRMYSEYYVSLPGGFRLPLGISVDRYRDYTFREAERSRDDAESLLRQFSDESIQQQTIAGQIRQKQQKLYVTESLYRLRSSYVCEELIGREYREQIGDINEQRS